MTRTYRMSMALFALLGFMAAACGSSDLEQAGTTAATVVPRSGAVPVVPLSGAITIFAASSLNSAFKAIGDAFVKANPAVKVTFSFDASSALVAQIIQGAPADVFASADTANMDKMVAVSLNGSAPVSFATNLLSIIVASGNPKGIKTEADLAKSGLRVVLCDQTVPCGKYAQQSLDKAGVAVTPVSLEQNVKGVVTKVTAGEADAGLVYSTDVQAAGDRAAGVVIPADLNVKATYPIASVKSSTHSDIDTAFITFVAEAGGQAILAKYGFGKP